MLKALWVDKYAPTTLNEIVLKSETKELLHSFVSNGSIPNLIFYSDAGRGKTTLAKVLIKELGASYIALNASLDTSVDVIRERVVQFCSTTSFSKNKIVLCDEADGMSQQALISLKGVIEKYQNVCRFIFTTNELNKLPDPLLSRCQLIEFNDATKKDIRLHCEQILTKENKTFDRNELKTLITDFYPDIRQIVHMLERNSQQDCFKYETNNVSTFESNFLQIFTKSGSNESKWQQFREMFVAYDFNDWDKIYTILFNNIEMFDTNYINVSIILAKYLHQSKTIPNREINLMACLSEILKLKNVDLTQTIVELKSEIKVQYKIIKSLQSNNAVEDDEGIYE